MWGEFAVCHITNCQGRRQQLERFSSPAAEGVSLLGRLVGSSARGPEHLSLEVTLTPQPIQGSGPRKERLQVGAHLPLPEIASESLRSLISLKEGLAVGEPGTHDSASCVAPLSWSFGGGWRPLECVSLPPPSVCLPTPQASSVTSISRSCSPDSSSLPLSHLFICLLPAASGFLSSGLIPISLVLLTSDRPAIQRRRALSFCFCFFLILLREQENARARQ